MSEKRQHAGTFSIQFVRGLVVAFSLLASSTLLPAQTSNAPALSPGQALVVVMEGTNVTFSRIQTQPPQWDRAYETQIFNPGDRVKVGEKNRLLLRFSDQSTVWFDERSDFVIEAPEPKTQSSILLFFGRLFFFDRGPVGQQRVRSRTGSAAVRGTEFAVEVDQNDTMTVSVLDGAVVLSNDQDQIELSNYEQGRAVPGQTPVRTARIDARNVIQWCLYYPAILHLDELRLAPAEQAALGNSLAAYQSGDLLAALQNYPANRQPVSDEERIYFAALLLSVGQVEETDRLLNAVNPGRAPDDRASLLVSALRTLIAVVKGQPRPSRETNRTNMTDENSASTASLLADSYYEQSQFRLTNALQKAQQATQNSPQFSFAWARVAELEFSFGRTAKALDATEKSLSLASNNAEALAVKGFLLAAQNRAGEAIQFFNQAIAIDGSLGNAWLGRGLCKIRRGQAKAGQQDLQVAASVEPQRALFRSYLSKAYSHAGEDARAAHEIELAQRLDPGDPTSWLYSALEKYQQNRINEAVHDLERSIDLNDNRALFRSRLLLDQDRAVRNASVAKIYQSAGLDEVALREASKAVTYDYANHSAHQFLAESYDALRDPARFNLRYETVWFNELLLANVLSPVGAGLLSQNISQQEYSRLFERNHVGFLSSTEYRSDGQLREIASHYGLVGPLSYTLDLDYQYNDGIRPNNDLSRIEWYSQFKYQLTAKDSLFVLTKYQDYDAGDNFQHYDPAVASSTLRVKESQAPIVMAALHREWQPGVHTTLLAGRLDDNFDSSAMSSVLDLRTNVDSSLHSIVERSFDDTRFANHFTAYFGELNQIFQRERTTFVGGIRGQSGRVETETILNQPGAAASFSNRFSPPVQTSLDESLQRATVYALLTRELWSRFRLTVGAAYDHVEYPDGFRSAPVSSGARTRDRLSPKAGLVWDMLPQVTVRGVYAQSLGGVAFDESVRLEPTQLAGFPTSFRTLISEAEAGSVIAPRHDIGGLALDLKPTHMTFVGFGAQWAKSSAEQELGVFKGPPALAMAFPTSTPEVLNYRERSLSASIDQLIGNLWNLGASYRLTESRLDWYYSEIPAGTPLLPPRNPSDLSRTESALLHQISGRFGFNHPSGLFARAESRWFLQHNGGYPNAFNAARPDESLYQLDIFAGYRFLSRRGELLLGVLNVTDQDYRLNSLTPYSDLPRERVWMTRLKLNF